MTSKDVEKLVAGEIASYAYPVVEGTVGRPWSADRVASELELLKSALVSPRPAKMHVRDECNKLVRTSPAWVVAQVATGEVVVFEPATREFWLAEGEEPDGLTTYGVNGDLVGVFMAR